MFKKPRKETSERFARRQHVGNMPIGARDATSRLPQASSRRSARRENFELPRWIDADRPVWSCFRISPIAWHGHLFHIYFSVSYFARRCEGLYAIFWMKLYFEHCDSDECHQRSWPNTGIEGGGVVVSLRFRYILYTCWIEYVTFRAEAQSSTTFSFPLLYCTARRHWVVMLKMTRGKVVLSVVAFPCCANFCGSVLHTTKLSIYS